MILVLKNENWRNLMTVEKGTLKFLSNREHAIIAKVETEDTVVIVNASDRINLVDWQLNNTALNGEKSTNPTEIHRAQVKKTMDELKLLPHVGKNFQNT